ncbi:hypothetical protein BOTBODRAFT_52293 [Botryobasidium botryosum FD-172 SS1]|uniref:Uncharacterized protein n=1 Tax=Botryobasidium botryosum (strain FD-172 SS1) TaxID=930990 RepID=A0A067N5Q7_BOTB1|nr:hypothetical protein BOTBODRAFT_52293 [Botryobasidium botryosum FD-172 SS1]
MYPDIAETKGGPDAVKKRLAEVLPIVWEQIDNAFLEGLVKSMPRRVQAVIAAHGWNAKY